MKLRPKRKIQILQVGVITAFWIGCAILLALYKCVTYSPAEEDYIFLVPLGLPLWKFILINLVGPLAGGLLGGIILVGFLNEKLRNTNYLNFLIINIGFFFVFIAGLNTAVSYFFYYKETISASDNPGQKALDLLLWDPYAIRNILSWMLIVCLTLMGLRMYEKYGPGTVLSMFLGKYHRPHEVERVFMFLDLKNATGIAEKLGHVRFFELLQDFFRDSTDPILNSKGVIYQYVGDEISVSWSGRRAAEEGHALACFFRIEEVIRAKSEAYRGKFGLVPEFKAALHRGSVVVGELGVIKREIVYSGDILNTTSRMMEQCKLLGPKCIVSEEVLGLFGPEVLEQYALTPLGALTLRGKSRAVSLFGIQKRELGEEIIKEGKEGMGLAGDSA